MSPLLPLLAALLAPALLDDSVPQQSVYEVQVPGGAGCPPALSQRVCKRTCAYDGHCPDDLKCCETKCGGAVCSKPDTVSRISLAPAEKKGECPNPPPRKPRVRSDRCSLDVECRGPFKCCRTSLGGHACLLPHDY